MSRAIAVVAGLLGIVVFITLLSSFYFVQQTEEALVLQFGAPAPVEPQRGDRVDHHGVLLLTMIRQGPPDDPYGGRDNALAATEYRPALRGLHPTRRSDRPAATS